MYHLTLKSSNKKTGTIPVSTSPQSNCPLDCPLYKNGCYGENHGLNFHWNKVSNNQRGVNWSQFIDQIQSIPNGSIWRHNQVGDLEGLKDNDNLIDPVKLGELVKANIGKRGFTYTHKTENPKNHYWIEQANNWGFTINLSANNLDHADYLMGLNIAPVVTILPSDSPKKQITKNGNTVITCPQTYIDDLTCADCKLCQIRDRSTIVGFPSHGSGKNKVNKVFEIKAIQ